jgi:hypothetical protein
LWPQPATIYPRNRILLPAEEEVATMLVNAFGAGVAAAVRTAATSHAAVPEAAIKHRAAAATDASVDRGHT